MDIPRSFFQQYRFHQTTQLDPLLQQQEHQDDIELGLDLIPFIECLNMLAIVNPSSSSSHTDHHHQSSSSSSSTGSSTAILGKITVKSDLSLQIMLDQPGHALTVCNLSTFPSADAMAEYASGGGDAGGVGGGRINDLFLDSNLAASVMIKAAWLKEALTDLDKSAIDVCFQFVPSRAGGGSGVGVGVGGTAASTTNSGSFRVFAQGMSGETEVKYMRDAVEEFFCRQSLARQPRSGGHSHDYELRDEEDDVEIDHNNNGYTFKYNYSMLQSTFKVFSHNAQKVHLKVTDSGAMSMTFMLSTEMKDVNAFAEFLVRRGSRDGAVVVFLKKTLPHPSFLLDPPCVFC